VTREALVLRIATPGEHTPQEVDAMRAGLLQAVDRMKADKTLPKASDLTDEALDNSDLPGLVEWGIRHLPDSLINGVVKTDDVLRRAISELDDPDALTRQINSAVSKAVKDSILARLRDLLPG
jgi:hypothetical protein